MRVNRTLLLELTREDDVSVRPPASSPNAIVRLIAFSRRETKRTKSPILLAAFRMYAKLRMQSAVVSMCMPTCDPTTESSSYVGQPCVRLS